jgi:UDP-3-O-[3-hydroxymyristoyl] glucosamine N-acyltransferase
MARLTRKQIGEMFGLAPGEEERVFTRVSGYETADAEAIVFARDAAALEIAIESAAGLILAPLGTAPGRDARVAAVKDPKYAFAVCARWLEGPKAGGVHASARVAESAVLGEGTSVGAGSVIEAGVRIGAGCEIGSRVTIQAGSKIGNGVVVQAGAVLGSTGFGYVRGPDGRYVRFPQIGTLWVGDDVEIGANCTIDRGALGETRIGRGTKIDNLVHIGHNCRIGEDVMIAAQVGLAGSCVVEDGAMLGGQVGLGENVEIGAGVMLGGQGGVLPGKRLDGAGKVFWGTPARPVREYLRDLARLKKG